MSVTETVGHLLTTLFKSGGSDFAANYMLGRGGPMEQMAMDSMADSHTPQLAGQSQFLAEQAPDKDEPGWLATQFTRFAGGVGALWTSDLDQGWFSPSTLAVFLTGAGTANEALEHTGSMLASIPIGAATGEAGDQIAKMAEKTGLVSGSKARWAGIFGSAGLAYGANALADSLHPGTDDDDVPQGVQHNRAIGDDGQQMAGQQQALSGDSRSVFSMGGIAMMVIGVALLAMLFKGLKGGLKGIGNMFGLGGDDEAPEATADNQSPRQQTPDMSTAPA